MTNVGFRLSSEAASYPRRTEVSYINQIDKDCSNNLQPSRGWMCCVIDTVVLQLVAVTAVVTETGVDVTNVYQRMRGTRLLGLFMSWFIFAIVILIDGVYGLKISEFGTSYFRERMGQAGAVCCIAVVSHTVQGLYCDWESINRIFISA